MLRTTILALVVASTRPYTPAHAQAAAVQRSPTRDGEMLAAEKQARDTLPSFWRRLQSGDPQIDLALVKVGYPTSNGRGMEYLWVAVGPHSDTDRRGQLVSEPEDVPNLHRGQMVSLPLDRIDDWSYRRAGKFYGQFTTRVMIRRADSATAAAQSAGLSPTPLEPGSK